MKNILAGKLSGGDKKRLAADLVGIEHVPTRALKSLLQIGKNLVGRPQLFSSVQIAGGVAAYIVRRIALDEELPSGRYFFSLAELFNLAKSDLALTAERKSIISSLSGGKK